MSYRTDDGLFYLKAAATELPAIEPAPYPELKFLGF